MERVAAQRTGAFQPLCAISIPTAHRRFPAVVRDFNVRRDRMERVVSNLIRTANCRTLEV